MNPVIEHAEQLASDESHPGYDRLLDAIETRHDRTLKVSEHVGDPFVCGQCGRRVRDGLGYTVAVVEDAGAIPIDGVMCSEDCAELAAQRLANCEEARS